MSAEMNEKVSKRLLFMGFFGLPLFWLINVLTFFPKWSTLEESVRRNVKMSAVGFVVSVSAIVAWALVFQSDVEYWRSLYPDLVITAPRPIERWDQENV